LKCSFEIYLVLFLAHTRTEDNHRSLSPSNSIIIIAANFFGGQQALNYEFHNVYEDKMRLACGWCAAGWELQADGQIGQTGHT